MAEVIETSYYLLLVFLSILLSLRQLIIQSIGSTYQVSDPIVADYSSNLLHEIPSASIPTSHISPEKYIIQAMRKSVLNLFAKSFCPSRLVRNKILPLSGRHNTLLADKTLPRLYIVRCNCYCSCEDILLV
jgi:hypothetical protein